MKDTGLETEVTNLCLEQVQASDTLPAFPQTGLNSDLKKTNTSHRKPEVTSMTLQSLVLLLRLAPSAAVMISGRHMHSSFENMTKIWQTPTYKEQHS